MVRRFLLLLLTLPLVVVVLHTIIRVIRHFYKFPIPQFLANAIDNPFRRRIQPPDETPIRHGVDPGMNVLEIGPGNGTYTLATARRVGPNGKLVTVDIEPKMIARVQAKLENAGLTNVEARVADIYLLPFESNHFDLVYMIAVIGEIPSPGMAIREFHRVLKLSGKLVFSELFMDPDYPLAKTLVSLVEQHGFRLQEYLGNFFYYTLIFEKVLI
jgi:ubiquinone/menaquinone biosynthesis C-methylase UbiE